MREIRLYGSEGGGAEANRLSLPLSSSTLRVFPGRTLGLEKRTRGGCEFFKIPLEFKK